MISTIRSNFSLDRLKLVKTLLLKLQFRPIQFIYYFFNLVLMRFDIVGVDTEGQAPVFEIGGTQWERCLKRCEQYFCGGTAGRESVQDQLDNRERRAVEPATVGTGGRAADRHTLGEKGRIVLPQTLHGGVIG